MSSFSKIVGKNIALLGLCGLTGCSLLEHKDVNTSGACLLQAQEAPATAMNGRNYILLPATHDVVMAKLYSGQSVLAPVNTKPIVSPVVVPVESQSSINPPLKTTYSQFLTSVAVVPSQGLTYGVVTHQATVTVNTNHTNQNKGVNDVNQ